MRKTSSFLNHHFTTTTKLAETLAFSLLALALSACASIVSKTQYPLNISSNPSGAHYVIKKQNGVIVSQGFTPSKVMLKSSAGYFQAAKYVVDLDYKGQKQQFLCEGNINPWYFANLISWGLAGLVIVDPLTGAMWKMEDVSTVNFRP